MAAVKTMVQCCIAVFNVDRKDPDVVKLCDMMMVGAIAMCKRCNVAELLERFVKDELAVSHSEAASESLQRRFKIKKRAGGGAKVAPSA